MNKAKEHACNVIDSYSSVFTELSDRIWEYAELSLKEYRSAQAYVEILKKNGFAVTEKMGGMDTAFCGMYGSGRPVIGILGEFDALSGLNQKRAWPAPQSDNPGESGHGCGHNLLGAGSLAAAFALKDYLQESGREGTVIFFGCPGEEGGAGKAFLAKENVWRSLDAALTWHPEDMNEVVSGTNNSCIQILYEYEGAAAHAAGDPENGRSALDAVELMNTGVQYLREHMKTDCRVHYAIIDGGGVSPNVVQAHASVLYMVRAVKCRDTKDLLRRVDRIAEGAALMTETKLKRTFIDATANLLPNFALEELLQENFSLIGVPAYSAEELELAEKIKEYCPKGQIPGIAARYDEAAGKEVALLSENGTKPLNDFLAPLVHTFGYMPGSSDVGDVSWQTPAAQIHVTAFVSGAPGHSWQNVSCAGSSIGHKSLLTAGKVLACAAIDLFENPEVLARVRAEFEEKSAGGYECLIEDGAEPIAI